MAPASEPSALHYKRALPALSAEEAAGDEVIRVLQQAGFPAYRVGGCVRDRLLGRPVADVDVATGAVPAKVQALFPHTYAVGLAFGVVVVHVSDGLDVEVATFREERGYADGRHPDQVQFSSPSADAARRDFTVNALYYDPALGEIVDYVSGMADLERGCLRAIGDPTARFQEDSLRLLRATRFAADLGFVLDPATAGAVPPLAATLTRVSAERIYVELTRMLTGRNPRRAFELLFELGLLHVCLPELAAMAGVRQPPQFHPEGDVWVHTLLMLAAMRRPSEALAWAVLLHDVGKPPTYELRDGRERFPGHADAGAELSRTILLRLRASARQNDAVAAMVAYHMTFSEVSRMRPATLRRLLGRPTFPDDLELHRIDCMSSHGHTDNYVLLLDQLHTYSQAPVLPPPLLSGRDLLALGMHPGPAVGALLLTAREMQLNGELNSPDEARAWAQSQIPPHA